MIYMYEVKLYVYDQCKILCKAYHYTISDIKNINCVTRYFFLDNTTKNDRSCITYNFHSKVTNRWHTLSTAFRYNPLAYKWKHLII